MARISQRKVGQFLAASQAAATTGEKGKALEDRVVSVSLRRAADSTVTSGKMGRTQCLGAPLVPAVCHAPKRDQLYR